MHVSLWLALGFVGIVNGITMDDLYPFYPEHDFRLPNGDSESSHKITLAVPTKFYNNEYDYLWINIDGYISFEPDTSDVPTSDFPFREALLSPYMSNLDTSNSGNVFYRESNDFGVLFRATADIKLAFPVAAADFEAESVFIVTWHEVEGRSLEGEVATFTFQSVLVSNGRDTFAIFLYPEHRMGVLSSGGKRKSTMFQARAGFNEGSEQYLEMYPVDSLVDHRNTRKNGEWIFQIGGEGVRDNHDIVAPEKVRHVKRQVTSLINVQEVNLEEEEGDIESEEEGGGEPLPPSAHDFCARDPEACSAENSQCVNHNEGYCCRCLAGFYGNGKICLEDATPVGVNGNVSGTVDVRSSDGTIERVTVSNVDFHSYVITNEGRAYTAVSGTGSELGRALQPISALGEIVGWLFAVPTPPAINGFQFTGGSLQRRVSIRYSTGDYRFDMRQRFLGVREENDVSVVIAHTNFVGMLPAISPSSSVKMATYEETYVKEGSGRISSTSERNYTVDDDLYTYVITQSIIFSECKDSFSSVPDELNLLVSGTFLNYHDDDNNVRYAMNDKITAPVSADIPTHPCDVGNHGCDSNAGCEPLEGQDFTCRCRQGFAGNGFACEDFDECVQSPCQDNAECFNEPGSFICACRVGFVLNDETQECVGSAEPEQQHPCNVPGTCGVGTCVPFGDTYTCNCPGGFYVDNSRCADLDECAENRHNCAADAHCTNTESSFVCECLPGFTGDGVTCNQIECPGNQVFSTCAGCFTTCEQVGKPQICTLQCRVQCTCPPNTYLNGDMCLAEEDCPAQTPKTRCQLEYAQVDEIIRENPTLQDGPDHPTCLPDGSFDRRQCNGFTQVCWCVNPEYGTIIPGSMSEPDQGYSLNCTVPDEISTLTYCQRQHAETTFFHNNNPTIQDGPNFPECRPDGSFAPRQCNGFTQVCWCVEGNTGDIVPDTLTPPDSDNPLVGNSLVCPVLSSNACRNVYAELEEFLRQNPDVQDGPNFPTCLSDGRYDSRQCNSLTRVCWCVDTQTGAVIPGTMTAPGEGDDLDCTAVGRPSAANVSISQCRQKFAEVEEFLRSNPTVQDGPSYPTCKVDGSFAPKQCNRFTQVCWCVEAEFGTMMPDTMTAPGNGHTLTCRGPRPPPSSDYVSNCETLFSEVQDFLQQNPGVQDGPNYPYCAVDGSFEPRQCNRQTRVCWCVDTQSGVVVPDTMTALGEGPRLDCSAVRSEPVANVVTQCQQKFAEVEEFHFANPEVQDGPNFPICLDDGSFAPRQCNGFTNYCWCVEPQFGTIKQGTMTAPRDVHRLNCPDDRSQPSSDAVSPCRTKYDQVQEFLDQNPDIQDGPNFPVCARDGSFAPEQCNGFTNVCWCVERQFGTIVAGTMTRPGEGDSLDCSVIEPTVTNSASHCRKHHAEAEEFHRRNPDIADGPDYPVCMPDGSFARKQCNGFTQACWCVETMFGTLIQGTMTRQGDRLTCDSDATLSPCQQRYAEVEEFLRDHPEVQDGPSFPVCMPDGSFSPKQCNGFTQVCWCVETESGEIMLGTMTEPDEGDSLNCPPLEGPGNDPVPVPTLTQCQQDREAAEQAQSHGSARGPIFQPLCTEAGAYEPIQYHPNRYYMCVDFNGVEVSRHDTLPACLSTCLLQAYYAETENIFVGTSNFVPQCTEDGSYSGVQCDRATETCYCADRNGEEIPNTRISTDDPESVTEETLECAQLDPTRDQSGMAAQIVFAQSTGVNALTLPITADSTAQRLYGRIGHTAVGVAFDCASQTLFWTDVSGRGIYKTSLADPNSRTTIVNSGLRSPEGVAVDYISGNIYWTDSGADRIEVAKLDGSSRAVLISTGLHNPRGIAVDPFGAKMYWTDWYRQDPKIMVANLDGTEASVLVSDGLKLPNDITIDPFHRRLCFVDAGTKKVECMNLDGSQRSSVYEITSSSAPGVQAPFGLAVDGGKVYYTDRRNDRLHAVNTANGERVSLSGPIGSHGHMFGVAIAHTQCPRGYNRCSAADNGGCFDKLCLPTPGGRTCKCADNDDACSEE